MTRPTVPHHEEIGPDCPLDCLVSLLSLMSYNRLRQADEPPRTAGDVVDLYARNELRDIRGLGPKRIAEIGAALVFAGFNLTGREQSAQPAGSGNHRPAGRNAPLSGRLNDPGSPRAGLPAPDART